MNARIPTLVLAAALVAGCAAPGGGARAPGARPAPDAPPAAETEPATADELDLAIEADHVRLTVPDRLAGNLERTGPRAWKVGGLRVRSRESDVVIVRGGEALAVVAEGIVKTVRTTGAIEVREGPYRTLLLRDGRLLRR